MKKFFNWIICNFQEEIHNLPLFIPVFIGLGIVFYFSLENEPATWLIYLLFGITSFFFFFINLGNSSDRIKHYKLVVAFSAFKYIFKKLLKIFLFALLLPIIGHITLFVLIGSWVVSLFEYSYYLRYFALLYDNALMREIIKGVSFILSPITKEIRKTKFYKYLKNIAKTEIKKTKKKKTKQKKIWKLFISTTKNLSYALYKIFTKFWNNTIFKSIFKIKGIITKFLNNILKRLKKEIGKYLPEKFIETFASFLLGLNFIIFFFILGVFVVKLRTNNINTHLLFSKIQDAEISARVIDSEIYDNNYRITLDNVNIKNADVKLDKIRIKFNSEFGLPIIGKTISFKSSLIPPFEPNVIGGFNFAQYAFYKKLSASGRMETPWKYTETQIKNSTSKQILFDFLNLRNRINTIIKKDLPANTSGVVISMTTGERYPIPKEIAENYQRAGISHLLAISGFHMTLFVGFAFFIIRFLLALNGHIANKYDTKKITAILTFFVALFYLFISGARLPTERAFIMMTLGLMAILFDRNPFSLRLVATSAVLILLFSPEALINAGFQMSFVAVIVLIKLYESKQKWLIKTESENKFLILFTKFLNAIWSMVLTALIVSTAITPFIIFNFNNIQLYSVLGNFFAIPIFSFIVMPSILLAFIFMPFGLEKIFFQITGFGVNSINYFASIVSEIPYASLSVKSINITALSLIIIGGIWLFLWSKKWKNFGWIFIVYGIIYYINSPIPNIFVNKYGNIFGIVKNNELQLLNTSKYLIGEKLIDDWNKTIGKKATKIITNKTFTINDLTFTIVEKYKDYKKACVNSDIIFTTFAKEKAFFKCQKPVFDKKFFTNNEGTEFFFKDKKFIYKTLKSYIGQRPWSMKHWTMADNIPSSLIGEVKLFE